MHGGTSGELRTRCVFRYYAKRGALTIDAAEVFLLYKDIALTNKNAGKLKNSTEVEVEAFYNKAKWDRSTPIPYETFVRFVGLLYIRGTATIYRAARSPLAEMRSKRLHESLVARPEVNLELFESCSISKVPQPRKRLCHRCRRQYYSQALHSLFLSVPPAACGLVISMLGSEIELPPLVARARTPIRDQSLQLMNSTNVYNELRTILRRFSAICFGFPAVDLTDRSVPRW